MKFPKRLKVDRACYYQLPGDTDASELTFHEIMFRRHYQGIFTERIGHTFFFQLPTTRDRDVFLDLLDGMCRSKGLPTKREIVYSTKA
jgi:hypothetical protein